MIPFIVLVVSFAVLRTLGILGVSLLDAWEPALRGALALMFLFTATAHWGRRRPDLIKMVPTVLPWPGFLVTLTGVLLMAGALGLLVPLTATLAAAALAVLLVVLFPANVRAGREGLTIGGRAPPALPLRAAIQVVFLVALGAIVWATMTTA